MILKKPNLITNLGFNLLHIYTKANLRIQSGKPLPFPSSYLVKCGFSAVSDLLLKKRNRLDITKRGDLRFKLSKLVPRINALCAKHQAQGSH